MTDVSAERLLFNRVDATVGNLIGNDGVGIVEGGVSGFRSSLLGMVLQRTVEPPEITAVVFYPGSKLIDSQPATCRRSGCVCEAGVYDARP